ncbi:aspartate kinase [Muriicola jejuensis]|uniref:Bifunctional aspartate kinase/homoserine dehydrogenase I n=1 Tax=Muriicola jejuensis TaxID=504488 RepID=A0A6P0UAH4_9FLAO|nr:bifunctional aspartate kinase/homoserine dehydrogenase I [Muriicola jejuensis]NER08929.1 bifunctional aspartate kinase/homoserine dehydrogenase I [Muriicola jejuensis]SMP12813.1 aspartate kinase [Muriicola jejuensis]
MKVLKFGGTSVASSGVIKQVREISANSKAERIAVVVSALGGVTDLLLDTMHTASRQDASFRKALKGIEDRHLEVVRELLPTKAQSGILSKVKSELNVLETLLEGAYYIGEVTPRLSDKVVSYGELLSAFIISEYFKVSGLDAVFKDSRELLITDQTHGKAAVDFKETDKRIIHYFEEESAKVVILPGFIASSEDGNVTTLGRGGSDYTASIIAAALKVDELQIWTDVSGMFTANPKIVKQAKPIAHISYEEAMELSHFGAKVLYPPTVQPVLAKGLPISIKNTFDPDAAGTLITRKSPEEGRTVRGISYIPGISLLSLEGPGMIGIPGISKRFFEVLSLANISVVLITQASSEHSICIGIADEDASKAIKEIDKAFAFERSQGKIKPVAHEKDLAIIALVGDQMKNHQGLSGRMFSTLGKNNVNIRAIAQGASERNISAVIRKEDVKKALNTLHETFFEENVKQLNLYVLGCGNVGSKLLEQLRKQRKYLKEHLRLNIRVLGISNSRRMYFDEQGISLQNWQDLLAGGEKANAGEFFKTIQKINARNSILVDNTASEKVAESYPRYLRESISVVTCNKIACSSAYENYRQLKELAKQFRAPFLFETNVGAGLPIIDTLKHLVASGDEVLEIKAVLSGSLNFVFDHFDEHTTFHDVVKQAQEQGYTEPDPKIDLSGIDVMRKILILARESGFKLELSDIENRSFLPEEALKTKDNNQFFAALQKHEAEFQQLVRDAKAKKCKLKFVASLKEGKASVGLEHIPQGHDFYSLAGSDNIVLFYTKRYPKQPLIIKGAGAGADVTASGIFADIIRIGTY